MSEVIMKPFGAKAHQFIVRHPKHDKRYTWLIGSVRSAKTFTLSAKTIVGLSRYEVAGKRLMTGATKQTLYRNVLIDLFNVVGASNFSYNQSTGELWLLGKQWFCMGAKDEASYKQILGATVGVWVGDEVVEYPKSYIAQMFLRMSPDGARAYGSTNPANPYVYFKTDVLDNPAFDGRQEVIHFTLNDNPNISAEAKDAIIASQKGVYKLRYIDGLWVAAEGAIYRDCWDDEESTFAEVERKEKINGRVCTIQGEPRGLRARGGYVDHWFSCDPGVDHRHVYHEYFDDGKVIWVTREWVWDSRERMKQLTDAQYSAELREFMGGTPKYEIILPPEAASLQAQFVQDGFWVTDADNSVVEGIHTVSGMLGVRKLRISRDGCPETVKRLPQYAWNEEASKRGVEEPRKVADDECDSIRYGVHTKIQPWRLTE